jgi:hypothetical protein
MSKKITPGGTEVGSSPFPYAIDSPICKLGRKPDILFWGTKCNDTPYNGPCWLWVDENGSQVDVEFNQYSQKSD